MAISAEQHRVRVGNFAGGLRGFGRTPVPLGLLYLFCSYRNIYSHVNLQCFSYQCFNNAQNLSSNIKNAFISIFLALFFYLILLTLTITLTFEGIHEIKYFHDAQPKFVVNLLSKYLINWTVIVLFMSQTGNIHDKLSPTVSLLNLHIVPTNLFTFISNPNKFHCSNLITFIKLRTKRMTTKYSRCMTLYSYYVTIINLTLIVLVTPNIVNPGPSTKELSVAYFNTQGFILMSSIQGNQPIFQTNK